MLFDYLDDSDCNHHDMGYSTISGPDRHDVERLMVQRLELQWDQSLGQ